MASAQRTEQTPLVIRGESPAGEVAIDTLSVTMPVSEVERVVGGTVSGWTLSHEQLLSVFQGFIDWLFAPGLFTAVEIGGKRNGFENTVKLDGASGFIAWGGNNKKVDGSGQITEFVPERLQLYLDGQGCARSIDWSLLAKRLVSMVDVRITRCDVAFDDHFGSTDVQTAVMMYDLGEFTSSGRPPKAKYIDDKDSGEGKTLYVGKRESGKMLRVYEKGKQLGDPLSLWIRWEIEFSNKDREIPFDILLHPRHYISGAYPALSWIGKIREVIKTARLKLDIQFAKLMQIAKHQYGKLLHFAHTHVRIPADEVFDRLVNYDDVPDRLKWCLNVNVNPEDSYHVAC
jgi:hypothetical protein